MVFLGCDGAFSGISELQVWRKKLESDAGILHDLFEASWALVVEHLKVRR